MSQEQAEAHAEAARDFIMVELVAKSDLRTALATLRAELTLRMGAAAAASIAILAAIIKLT